MTEMLERRGHGTVRRATVYWHVLRRTSRLGINQSMSVLLLPERAGRRGRRVCRGWEGRCAMVWPLLATVRAEGRMRRRGRGRPEVRWWVEEGMRDEGGTKKEGDVLLCKGAALLQRDS